MSKFEYDSGDLCIGKTQCEFCENFVGYENRGCKVLDKLENDVIKADRRCEHFESKNSIFPSPER